jgi:fatty acyl-CoA reductase
MIPVDFCANSIIAAGAFVKQQSVNEVRVFNCACNEDTSITWQEFFDMAIVASDKHPSPNAILAPGIKTYDFYPAFWLHFVLLHLIPAYVIDFILIAFRRKPMLANIAKKMFSGLTVTSPFMRNQWLWKNKNLMDLFEKLTNQDK